MIIIIIGVTRKGSELETIDEYKKYRDTSRTDLKVGGYNIDVTSKGQVLLERIKAS